MRTLSTKLPSKLSTIPSSTMKIPTSTPKRTSGGFSSQMLLFMFLIVIAFLVYLYSIHVAEIRAEYKPPYVGGIDPSVFLIPRPSGDSMVSTPIIGSSTGGLSTRYDVLSDPYIPPVKIDGYLFDSRSSDIRGLPPLVAPMQTNPTLVAPVNIETRGIQNQYTQVGILTKTSDSKPLFSRKQINTEENSTVENRLILPLMGRRHMTGRDKWQYYTISNTGNLNTKLPIRSNGRSCTSEYGCDPLYSGDMVYVEGYDHSFKVTIYENSIFSYLPVL